MDTCIAGLALGDAIGFLLEGADADKVGDLVTAMTMKGPDFGPDLFTSYTPDDWQTGEIYRPGQISDDTQCALMLADALTAGVNEPDALAHDFAARLQTAFRENRMVGYGLTTKLAFEQLEKGVAWRDSGSIHTTSNGAAMRVAPLGVYFQNEDDLLNAILAQGRVTHNSTISLLAAAAQGAAVFLAKKGFQTTDAFIHEWLSMVAKAADTLDAHLDAPPYEVIVSMMDAGFDAAIGLVQAIDHGIEHREKGGYGLTAYAPSSVLWAVYAYLRTPEHLWRSLITAISIGGDTDTVAAMCGAISAAANGPDSIPAWAQNWLHDRGAQLIA